MWLHSRNDAGPRRVGGCGRVSAGMRRYSVSNFRVRFEGPGALALSVATALADADGVELLSSDQPVTLDENIVALNVTVAAAFDAVADAVARIRSAMPAEATIKISSG